MAYSHQKASIAELKYKMNNRSPGVQLLQLSILVVLLAGCSKNEAKPSSNSAPTAQAPLGVIAGTVQISLGSGDVKSLAFKQVKLVQENYAILTEAEKQDIDYDVDQGSEALRLGVTSLNE
jgi:hypothetical protein